MIALRPVGVAAILLLLAACIGSVAELDRFKKDEAAGNTATIAGASLPAECDGDTQSDVCGQMNTIKARACLIEAQRTSAKDAACPASAYRDLLQCAAGRYALARRQGFAPPDPGAYAQNQAQAMYCLATMTAPTESAPLAEGAMKTLAAAPATASRDLIAGSSALNLARNGMLDRQRRCAAAKSAQAIAARGLGDGPTDKEAEALRSAIFNAGEVAKKLGCGAA